MYTNNRKGNKQLNTITQQRAIAAVWSALEFFKKLNFNLHNLFLLHVSMIE